MMKQLMILLFSLSVLLAACNDEPKTEDKPKAEVKINKADDAKKKIEEAKERGRKNADKTTEEDKFDTEKYNQARLCLTDAAIAGKGKCTDIENSEEYSKAWNNLTNEGYICQGNQCSLVETEAPTTEVPVTEAPVTEAPVTEAPVTETPVTEAPPVEEQTEQPVSPLPIEPGGLSTEAPIPEVAP